MSGFPTLTVTLRLWRQAPGATSGEWQEVQVTIARGDHVLNLLAEVRRLLDPSLCYPDHFCKIGTCGACALLVDGRAALGCRALVAAPTLSVAPPRGRRVLADLLAEERDA